METKTISYLNSKVWYRFVKVIYILFFVLLFAINNSVAFSYRAQLNYDKTLITCHIGTEGQKSFSLGESGAGFSSSNFDNYTYKSFFQNTENESGIELIVNRCTGVDFRNLPTDSVYGDLLQSVYDIQRYRDIAKDNPTFTAQQMQTKFSQDKASDPLNLNLSYGHPLFDITPKFDTNIFLEYLIIGNLAIALAFVVGQRIFYYIVLGTLMPKKHGAKSE